MVSLGQSVLEVSCIAWCWSSCWRVCLPVADSGGGNHSAFAKVFLDVLRENTGVLDGHRLFTLMRRPVMVNSDQTPEYGDIRKAGHGGGDFLFVRRR